MIELQFKIPRRLENSLAETLDVNLNLQLIIEQKPAQPPIGKIFVDNRKEALHIQHELKKLKSLKLSQFKMTSLPYKQWASRWKKGLRILKISKNLVIRPSWLSYKKKGEEKIIQIDPGMAFGTGHHETTRMCLEWIEACASAWQNICDVGCGSGILAISAVKLGAAKALGIDIDEEAVKTALDNAKLNRVHKNIKFISAPIRAKKLKQKFDAVFSNLTARDIEANWPYILRLVKNKGALILAGIEASQTHWFDAWLFKKKGVRLEDSKVQGGWHGYFLRRI